jgi:hypothetical protein
MNVGEIALVRNDNNEQVSLISESVMEIWINLHIAKENW